jgi:hypothetical protein
MTEPAQQSTSSPPPPQPRRTIGSVTLPTFWPNNPAAWFRSVEAQFEVKGITEAADKYYLDLASLGEAQVERVHNVLDEEPGENAYQKIKNTLLSTHTLTPFQMVDRIVNMEPLGSRKPTELLAAMARFRPKEDHHFFAYYFLQRLLSEIRVLLAHDCCKDLQAVAEKADALMALHLLQSHDITTVALVTDEAVPGSEEELLSRKAARRRRSGLRKSGRRRNAEGGIRVC